MHRKLHLRRRILAQVLAASIQPLQVPHAEPFPRARGAQQHSAQSGWPRSVYAAEDNIPPRIGWELAAGATSSATKSKVGPVGEPAGPAAS